MPKVIKIKKGLNIPLAGAADLVIERAPLSDYYAIRPADIHGVVPKMMVQEGEEVKAGTPLFFDKNNEKVIFTSPVSGVFVEVVRGERRKIMEVVVKSNGKNEFVEFGRTQLQDISREQIVDKLLKSGTWPFIRQRPFSVVANPADVPKAIFVSAFNSAPLASDLDFVASFDELDFQTGLDAVARLTNGKVHLSVDARNTKLQAFLGAKNVEIHHFEGPHPAGNIGTQIHHIMPINKGEKVWYVSVQDLIVIGRLFNQGVYDATRMVALVGPEVIKPRYCKMISGAQITPAVNGNVKEFQGNDLRFISGDVLTGIKIEAAGYLGFYDNLISVIKEGNQPEFMGWLIPNLNRFSISRTLPSFLMPGKKYSLDTMVRSAERPFVITGIYEKVMPMDILPMLLVKAIMTNDIERMELLGIYEVAPEDFALCEFVCPSKIEFQTIVRDGLDVIRKEFA